jgi:methyl-accepting chemotaxis protein
MSILARTLLAFSLVIAIGAAQSLFTVTGLESLNHEIELATTKPLTQVDAARAAWDGFRDTREMLANDIEGIRIKPSSESIAEFKQRIEVVETQLSRLIDTNPAKEAADIARESAGLIAEWKSAALVLIGDKPATAIPAPHMMNKLEMRIKVDLQSLVKHALKGADTARALVNGKASSTENWAIILAAVAVVFGLLLAIASAFSLTRPLARLRTSMNGLAKGDLQTEIIGQNRRDEIGEMAASVLKFKEGLVEGERVRAQQAELEQQTRLAAEAAAEKELQARLATEAIAEKERAALREIDIVINAAANGNFRERLPLEGKEGFMRDLSGSLNRVCGTTADALDEVIATLKSLSNGDLTSRVTGDYAGMFQELKDNLNTTSERLAEIVSDVTIGANEVTGAASEIADGTNDLSRRTEQQASSLEETAASMEEMSSTIKQNAENASNANKLAADARTVASTGGEVVGKAVEAMSRIEGSSQKISDIIGVIDEIAFQTNLLALNAAVEAARAGDAGKGFAVVASEVRSLAQRSSMAAKDIKTLIQESGAQVKDGVKLVHDAGSSLGGIVDSIKRVADIVSEIASASRQQATGVEEINKAVASMDEMTQQNSALVEENAAACRMLQEQARTMQQRMATFTIISSGQATRPATAEQRGTAVPAMVQSNKAKASIKSPTKKVAAGGRRSAAMQADDGWHDF